jgi:hypothetical protein
MGLDVSHDCWSGPYSSFNRFREALAEAAGLPPLRTMVGFAPDATVSWADFQDPIVPLIDHSDCDGTIEREFQISVANRLDELTPHLPELWRDSARAFANGLRAAHAAGEAVVFE